MQATAFAKINLALHVRARRADGYHELETLYAFLDDGDRLTVEIAARDTLRTVGEFGGALTDPFGNIVAKALGRLPRPEGWSVVLDKRLPVAAGIGGGSADAAAIFRLVDERLGLPADAFERAAALGADVPACIASEACVGRGIGTGLAPVVNDLGGTPVLLVNPRVPLSTAQVFAAWGGSDDGAMPAGTAREIALAGRNGLEAPAIALCPAISQVLDALRATDPLLARMSGSGATCFALYESAEAIAAAARDIARLQPDWWQLSARMR
ncbi:4-(cytidine 5'-diphospho)-2-C-methyl-D-erythritol kinase [Novosphingobium tardum]|uniref:4-diphosphocytidyl-2-C-methyl-D-erythritol kinase n=1 Tax=Novosphingobium tardum TaxID=1538021 RepID=A0ABV8RPV7_9SPHN